MKPLRDDLPKSRIAHKKRIRDVQKERAWQEFVRMYRPLIIRYGRKRSPTDTEDIAQKTLAWLAEILKESEKAVT